jgi:hypothetical protein
MLQPPRQVGFASCCLQHDRAARRIVGGEQQVVERRELGELPGELAATKRLLPRTRSKSDCRLWIE